MKLQQPSMSRHIRCQSRCIRMQPSLNPSICAAAVFRAMTHALMQVCPTCLYLVEGGGQANYCSTNWGNGFATNSAIVKDNDISDATPFLQAVLQKPWLAQVTA